MSSIRINYWAEGATDRAAARRLISHSGAEPGADYSRRRGAAPGKDHLDRRIAAFNAAAKFSPWLILRDSDGACAATLAKELLAEPAERMRLRIVVPAMEAWLLADRAAFADHLAVPEDRVPERPEEIGDVKECVLRLARRSRLRSVQVTLLPASRAGRREGSGYAQSLIEFIATRWEPKRAAANAPSLERALRAIATLC